MSNQSQALAAKLEPLRPIMERIATIDIDFGRHGIYSACLTSSVVKTFELVELTTQQEPSSSFFIVPTLRAITEDIIFLRFLSRFPHEDREMVLQNLMRIELMDMLEDQHIFFKSFRPFQAVLNPPEGADVNTWKAELRSFWSSNGWPAFGNKKNKSYKPPTREIAEKSDPGLLEVVYDFVYRFTSRTVHFNPQALLRLGWGPFSPSEPTLSDVTFSTKSLNPYYLTVIQVYGSYILCLYFGFFRDFLMQDHEDNAAVDGLREHLVYIMRWPEIVTFEEMNIPPPKERYESNPLTFAVCVGMARRALFPKKAKPSSASDKGRQMESEPKEQ